MALNFSLKIGLTGEERTTVRGELTDSEHEVLTSYVRQYGEFAECRPMKEGVPCRLQVHWSKDQGLSVDSNLPSRDDVAVLLHRLRPFILEREPASFSRVASILGKAVADPRFRAMLGQARERYDGREMQAQLKIACNEMIVNSQRVFDDWVNSCEFHRDVDRRESLDALLEHVPGDLFYGIVVNLLIDKANAVGDLACIVGLILGQTRELRAQIPL